MLINERIEKLIQEISFEVYEKNDIFCLAMLALLGEESIFLLGKPGIAKSLVSRRLKFAIENGKNFEYLMSKFSTPEEIYGPIDLRMLKEGRYVRNVEGYLPDCNVAFLDEIWKAGPSIQNTLLTIINEKIYRNGGIDTRVPLKLLISASNELPAVGEGLEALFDRFIIRYIGHGLKEEQNFESLLNGDSNLNIEVDPNLQIKLSEIEQWKKEIKKLEISREVFDFIKYFRKKLHKETNGEAYISDRRWKKIAGLMKTSAYFNSRNSVGLPDLFVIPYCIWDDEEQEQKYPKIFYDAFLELFGLEWRQEKNNLINELEVVNSQVAQIEAQYLRLTIYDSPIKNHTPIGSYYKINYFNSQENIECAFISASDWNKISAIPSDSFDVNIYFVGRNYKFIGQQSINSKAYKPDEIMFMKDKSKYKMQSDNPEMYNQEMNKLKDTVLKLEKGVKEISKKMYKMYKTYTEQTCLFFKEKYKLIIDAAFNSDELNSDNALNSSSSIDEINDSTNEEKPHNENSVNNNLNNLDNLF